MSKKNTAQLEIREQELTEAQAGGVSSEEVEGLILEHRENGRKLARSLLRRWRIYMPLDDLNSIVDLTLCEAAGRYNKDKGAAFMTFFFYHLRGNLVRTISKITRNNAVMSALSSDTPKHSGVEDISNSETLRSTYKAIYGFSNENDIPENAVLRKEKVELCRRAWSELDDLEREVLSRSFTDETALIDIANTLGYSRCHISRVKKRALQRLKENYVILENNEDVQPEPVKAAIQRKSIQRKSITADITPLLTSQQVRRGRRRRSLPTHIVKRTKLADKKLALRVNG